MVQQQTHEPSAWSAAAQWLLGKTRDNLTSDKLQGEKGLGVEGQSRAPWCCPPAPPPPGTPFPELCGYQ